MGNFFRFLGRHAGASIAGGVAIAAIAGGGIAYAATSSGSSSTATPTPAISTPPTTTAPASTSTGTGTAKTKAKAHGVRGTITAINGSTWTIETPKGVTVTVTITPQTTYGTKKSPATAATFTVGSPATVIGQHTAKTAITATRVIVPTKPLSSGTTSTTVAPAA